MSADQFGQFQKRFDDYNAYMTQAGSRINVMMPIRLLYQGNTTYLAENAVEIGDLLEDLIRLSSGKVYLKGSINVAKPDLVFQTSSLYAQVSHLSEFLLATLEDVSYSPVTVSQYVKNNSYAIWDVYPNDETFVNVELTID